MIRLLISMLCALGLAFAPAAAHAAMAQTMSASECSMDGEMPDMPNDQSGQSTMKCCTPACPATSAAALLPLPDAAAADFDRGPTLDAPSAKELVSALSSGLDPPPRA